MILSIEEVSTNHFTYFNISFMQWQVLHFRKCAMVALHWSAQGHHYPIFPPYPKNYSPFPYFYEFLIKAK
jgi:hypothetical protein